MTHRHLRDLRGPRHRHDRRSRDDRGSTTLEFAVVFCFVIIPLLFGIIQYSYQLWSLSMADAAGREMARAMSVGCDPTVATNAALGKIRQPAVSGGITPTVTYSYSGTTPPKIGDTISVRVQFQSLSLGFLPLPNGGRIDETAQARIENVPATAYTSC